VSSNTVAIQDLPAKQYIENDTNVMIFDEIISTSRNQLNWLLTELGGEMHA